MDAPNVVIPFAGSYNVRGIAGYTNTITNALDQRRVNCIYQAVRNTFTNSTTLYLAKRPGVTDSGSTFGDSGQVAYLAGYGSGQSGSNVTSIWVYSVSGNDVRVSDSSGTTTILTSAGSRPLYVDHCSIGGNDTVVLQVGTGFSAQTVWYSTARATWTQITDADFPDIIGKMEFLDGYAFAINDSAGVQRIYNSDPNSLSSWTATNYLTKQIQQDRTQGLARLGNQILAFGQETVEVYRNAGNVSGSPLESIQQLSSRVGLEVLNGHYYCTIGGRIYFSSRHGVAGNRRITSYDGARFETVSTQSIEKIFQEQSVLSVNAIRFAGRECVSLQLSSQTDSTQRWIVFFPEWNEWFEWNSTVFTPVNAAGHWHIGIGSNQHKLYGISLISDNWQDAGTNYDSVVQFKIPDNGNQRKSMSYAAIKGDTSRSAHTIGVQFSDDDGQTFSTSRDIDMTSANKTLRRCGSWKGQRHVRLTNSANLEGRMEAFLARVE